MTRIAIVGFGDRIKDIWHTLMKIDSNCKLVAIMDVRNEAIRGQLQSEGVSTGDIVFYDNIDEMLDRGGFDGVLIGTRCNFHTEYALKIIPAGIPLFLEKPVSTHMMDLMKLRDMNRKYPHSNDVTVVSFPLRVTPLLQEAKQFIDSGKIGTVEHVQAINNVPYGGVYFHHWYRNESIHGGLFLAKTTHDFDYINYLLGIRPVQIVAMASKQIFKGNKPVNLMCKNCDEQEICPESPINLRMAAETPWGEYCSFAADTGNEDSSSALVKYETGMHVSYSQNFFARKKAGARGARLLGYKGTVEFDWFTNEVKVYMHHSPKVEIHKLDSSQDRHMGGDGALARNFIDIMKGKDKSCSPLSAGILSAMMCMKAIESYQTNSFQDIKWPDEL